MFHHSIIPATADIQPCNRKHGYDIKLIGSANNDILTNEPVFSALTLYTDGNTETNVHVEVTDATGFIYTKYLLS